MKKQQEKQRKKPIKRRKSIKKRKKRKIRKVFVSSVAFFSATVFVVFCIYYVYFRTDFFNVKEVDIIVEDFYDREYLLEKSGINIGEKIFSIDRKKIKESIEQEVYINDVKVLYELPDRIYIKVNERQEKYQIIYDNQYIVIDEEGVVLNIYSEKSELKTIESLTDVIYNVGEEIKFSGVENNNKLFSIFELLKSKFGSDSVKNISILTKNCILLDTEYNTKIKLSLDEDLLYQMTFAIEIITERLSESLSVANGLIDFTKGESPVYIEEFQMEGVI